MKLKKGDKIDVFGYKTIVEKTESFIGFERKIWFKDRQKNIKWRFESEVLKIRFIPKLTHQCFNRSFWNVYDTFKNIKVYNKHVNLNSGTDALNECKKLNLNNRNTNLIMEKMKNYIGTKKLRAVPMNKEEYNKYRGWKTPSDEDPKEEGMLVEYENGGTPNHKDHKGYISWSPKRVFEDTYKEI
jgi:hypothetical protein